MRTLKDKYKKCLAFGTAFIIFLTLIPSVYSLELSSHDSYVLDFLSEVANLDISKYKIEPVSYSVQYPSHHGGLPYGVGCMNLKSDDNELRVSFTYLNNTLTGCFLNVLVGSPQFTQISTDISESAKSILQRYKSFANASYVEALSDMLSVVDLTKNVTALSSNVMLEVSNSGHQTKVSWRYSSNDIVFRSKVIGIHFENGVFCGFADSWTLYKIGSDELALTRDEAINMAIELVKDYPLKMVTGPNNSINVPFKLNTSKADTTLWGIAREPLTLYPIWSVQLYFENMSYNFYGFHVRIWADTKDVESISSLSSGGAMPEDNQTETIIIPEDTQTEQTNEQSSQQTPTDASNYLYIIGLGVIFAIAVIITTVALKKRNR
ncbi:MAG: hypothetical protein WC325_06380 [Candidatus Bathyarchaeia archaeon]|jgi:hypothetical protein